MEQSTHVGRAAAMRLLIILVLVWVAFSLPLALLAGRALRSRTRAPSLAEEVEDYLRAAPRPAQPVLASAFGVVAAFSLAALLGAGASSDLPEEAMVTLAQWHEQVFPEATTTTAVPVAPEPAAPGPTEAAPAPTAGHRVEAQHEPVALPAPPTTVPGDAPVAGDAPAPDGVAVHATDDGEHHAVDEPEEDDLDRARDDRGSGERGGPGSTEDRRHPSTTTTSSTSTTTTSTTQPPPSTTTTTSSTTTTVPARGG